MMNAKLTPIDFMTTQRMPAYRASERAAEGLQAWVAGKVADFNARRDCTGALRILGWSVVA